MRVLILVGEDVKLSASDLEPYLALPIQKNSYPEEGIAIIEASTDESVSWDWPEIVIVAGQVDVHRAHVDLRIGKTDDIIGTIVEFLATMDEVVMEE